MRINNALKNVFRIGIKILAVCAILYIPLSFAVAFLAIHWEDKIIADELNNIYIESSYADWTTADIAELGRLKIPGNWSFSANELYCTIMDECGTVIAYCAWIGGDNSLHPTSKEFMQVVTNNEIVDVEFKIDNSFLSINLSEFGTLTTKDNYGQKDYQYLKIHVDSIEGRYMFVFPQNTGTVHSDLHEIAEAMVYSFYYDL